MRLVIWTADHEPPHAHVYAKGRARIIGPALEGFRKASAQQPAEVERNGGQSRSPAKAAASPATGAKGGRPRKTP